jgi:hypothetical protein
MLFQMAIVTDKPCQPPKITIIDNSTINTAPKPFLRSESITISTRATLNCSGILDTK